MDLGTIAAIATMGGLGLIFAGGLAIADRKLRFEENPMIAEINEILPGANCGACGNAGCYDFAVKLTEGSASISGCPVGGEETSVSAAEILGIEAETAINMLPKVLCRGGKGTALDKPAEYSGPSNCAASHILAGGNKQCSYGCLGGGDCVDACQFGAIYIGSDELPKIIDELCTGCGMCAKACPRAVIEMHPADRDIFVYCKNHDDPKRSKEVCSAACLGCGICARKSDGGVEIVENLAVPNYEFLNPELIPFEKCRTGAIVNHSLEIAVD